MTLYDFMSQHKDIDELTVWDKDYDIEVYFYPSDLDMKDDTGKAEIIIAKHLNFENLFIHNNTDSIMADIENIFAGYVSEKWLLDFAESLM